MRKIAKILAFVLIFALLMTSLPVIAVETAEEIEIKAVDYYNEPNPSVFNNYGSLIAFAAGAVVEYAIVPPQGGTYKLFIDFGTDPGGNVLHVKVNDDEKLEKTIDTGGWENHAEIEIGNIILSEGDNILGLYVTSAGNVCTYKIRLVYQEPTAPAEFDSFTVAGNAIDSGDIIPRGTDCINVIFTENINSATAILTTADGEDDVTVNTQIIDNVVDVVLGETLDFSKDYQLSFSKVLDISGNNCTVPVLDFTASDETGDAGIATIETVDCYVAGLMVAFEGKMLGSKGQVIEGRKADVTLKNPSGKTIKEECVISDGDGKITFEYTLPANSVEGDYEVIVQGEYADETIEEVCTYDADFEVEDVVRDAYPFDNTLPAGAWVPYGSALGLGQGSVPKYNIKALKSGIYSISVNVGTDAGGVTLKTHVNGKEQASKKIETSGWDERLDFELCKVYMEAGVNTIGIEVVGSNNMYFRTLTLSYIKPAEFEGYNVAGGVIPRGTDCILASFSEEIDSAEAELKTTGGTIVATETVVSEKSVQVVLKETLDYLQEYTLTLAKVTDINGNVCETPKLTFTASDKDEDDGSATIVAKSCNAEGLIFSLEAEMLNSAGFGIKGRQADITVLNPDSDVIKNDSVISEENGKITYSLTIPKDSVAGVYTFVINGEYVAEAAEITQRYISDELRKEILDGFKGINADDEDPTGAVEDIFATYSKELNVDMKEIESLDDKDSFYSRFIGQSFEKMEDFDKAYSANYALELLEMAETKEEAEAIILNEEYAAALETEPGKYNCLKEQKDSFIDAIIALDRQETPKTFKDNYDILANAAMAKEAGKEDVTLSISNKKVKVGQTAEIAVECSKEIKDVTAYSIMVACESDDAAERLSFNAKSGNVKTTVNGVSVVFDVTGLDKTKAIKELGTLSYDTDDAETADFELCGEVVFSVAKIQYDIVCGINEANVSVTVSEPSSNSGRGGGGKTTTTSGAVSAARPSVDDEKDDESDKKEESGEPFDDIAEVTWATESIMELYNKGIISDSEDRKFRPDDNVSRAEFVKLLVAALGINDANAKVEFSDVSKDAWYYSYVANAVDYDLIKGDENNCFNPEEGITREDVCVIFGRVMEKLGYPVETDINAELFADDGKISDYAHDSVYVMRSFGIINGVGHGMFEPQGKTTRAMAAKMLVYFMEAMNI